MLALPMMATSAAAVTYQLVDLAFLSRLGEKPMAAVIIANQTLRQAMMLLLMGAGFGGQALIGRAVGEGRLDRAEHLAGQLVLLGAAFAGVMAALGLAIPEQLFALPGPDPAFAPYGVPYVRLVFLLSFGMVSTQFFGAILGGAGDTATPFFVMLVQTAVAIAAEWVLIFGHLGAPALGVRGVALGIAAGQAVAMAIGLSLLFGGRQRVHLRRRHLRPDPAALARILRLAWPPGLQMLGNVVATLAFLRLCRDFGESVQAAFAIGLRLAMVAPMICFPLAGAAATLVAQALGAGDVRRAWRVIGVALLVHGSVMGLLAAATLLFRREIVGLLSDDPEVIRIGSEYLLFAAGAFAAWALFFPFLRALQGAGDVFVPMLISLATTFGVALPLAFYLSRSTELGYTGIWIAFLASTAITTLGTGLRLASGRWTRRGAHWSASPGTS